MFSEACTVTVAIDATPETVWSLLTDAADFPRWNSTVTSIEGTIALGQTVKIRVPISKRTFAVKVKTFDAPRSLVWGDGHPPMFRGTREYALAPVAGGTTFTMTETFEGVMLPMIRRSLPDFVPVFTQYAADLKREAEEQTVGRP
jgi:uncharacterized protein YndB with AHSA1/START domain